MKYKLLSIAIALTMIFSSMPAHAINIQNAIDFVCKSSGGFALYRACGYTITGNISAGDQYAFDNYITWTDPEVSKPDFSMLMFYEAQVDNWHNNVGVVLDGFAAVKSDVDTLKTDVDSIQEEMDEKTVVYLGSTLKSNAKAVLKNVTISSGVGVVYLTSDGTIGGAALCTTVYDDSINLFINDATTAYQMSYELTNSNKTFTVTANKLTTANITTGVLGQDQANGANVRIQLMCE